MVFNLYGKEVGGPDIRVIDQLRVWCREQLRNYWTNRVIFPVRQTADEPFILLYVSQVYSDWFILVNEARTAVAEPEKGM